MLTPESRQSFSFDPHIVYIDHGGYGVTPKEVQVFRAEMQEKLEAAPRPFFDIECRAEWMATKAMVAHRFSARAEDIALIDNVTDGINAILRSLTLQPDDEILITSMTYGAIALAARHIARETGAHVVEAHVPFPAPSHAQCLQSIATALSPRTKLAILDHITSMTALVLPIVEMIQVCRDRGVAVLVDGAHAPGHVPLNLSALQADWYVANLHKWYFVPRGCGFLWAHQDRQENLMPAVLSWGIDEPFPHSFWWTGTRDPSNWRSIETAFAFVDRFGEDRVRRHNHALVREASRLLTKVWDVQNETPDNMTAGMTLVPLPECASFPATQVGRAKIQKSLWDSHQIVCPCMLFENRLYIRVSAQIYNNMDDYQRLAHSINVMKRQPLTAT